MKVLLLLLLVYGSLIRTTSANLEESKSNSTDVLQRSVRSIDNDEKKDKLLVEVLVFALIFLLLVAIALTVILCREYRKVENEEGLLEDVATKVERNEFKYEDLKDKFEIVETNLELVEDGNLGSGYFGEVWKYKLTHVNESEKIMMVALKKAKNERDKQEILKKEILIMALIPKHENVLSLVGAVTTKENEIWMVSALAHSDLEKYLKENKTRLTDLIEKDEHGFKTGSYFMVGFEPSKSIDQLSTFDLHFFAFQITRGMEFLAAQPCVHRDLALRNIFITDDKIVKIGDLGLARKHDKYKDCYYQKKDTALPPEVAPEIIRSEKKIKFTEKSDIWSCTLALYEIFTLKKADSSVLDRLKLEEIKYPPEPKYCLSETFEFMKFGWLLPNRRPTFAQYRLHFEIELKKFPRQIFDRITEKLQLEKKKQDELESWIRKDPEEIIPQEGTELSLLNSEHSRNNV